MSLASVSIRRPVLAIVFSITIVLFGLLGFNSLGVREFPSIDAPVITVSTNYLGASADVIESQITEPLERAVNAVAGIRTLTSVSREGRSTITVEFELGADLERAPTMCAIVSLPLLGGCLRTSTRRGSRRRTRTRRRCWGSPSKATSAISSNSRVWRMRSLSSGLQTIDDVAQVDVWGSRTFSMRLWIDPQRLAAYGLTLIDFAIRSATGECRVACGANRRVRCRTVDSRRRPSGYPRGL